MSMMPSFGEEPVALHQNSAHQRVWGYLPGTVPGKLQTPEHPMAVIHATKMRGRARSFDVCSLNVHVPCGPKQAYGELCGMTLRLSDNTVAAVAHRYRDDLAPLHGMAEARAIMRAVFLERLGLDVLKLDPGRSLSESELLKVYLPLKGLRSGMPLQYVLGQVNFHGLRLAIDPRVLIPRPETEEMVDRIIRAFPGGLGRIIDIGTGSGCIALALKQAFPKAQVIGIDVSSDALDLARSNAATTGIFVEWKEADVLSPEWENELASVAVERTVIVSNPPYVPRSEEAALDVHVRDHEPHVALFVPDEDPQLFYRAIGEAASRILKPGDELWFEGHWLHALSTAELIRSMPFAKVEAIVDISGIPRFIHAVK